MTSNVRYMVDSSGSRTSVVVPIKTWEKLNLEIKRLKSKMEILTGIQGAIEEVKLSKSGKIELKSLKDFLDEC